MIEKFEIVKGWTGLSPVALLRDDFDFKTRANGKRLIKASTLADSEVRTSSITEINWLEVETQCQKF